ncbi:Uma2 family endonuclease [Streptoalloteichus hindustanus]|uniref:Putative restriction endonuclease n=1 Tax=Streptoalloteichus hindustanus TaxID=2017 RepID=A0A1M5CJQ4_STRHI|nr:Uma2 family endonuclease [Streptoalloteichus hindustanus]SHF54931.1 Putative restriction endonuclease [Streptoalloteichus hindustanus]
MTHRPRRATSSSSCDGLPVTIAEYDALPVDNELRREIEDGCLLERERPGTSHAKALHRLTAQLDAQLPDRWGLYPEVVVELPVGASARRVPSLIVTSAERDVPRVPASDVLLAVEIVSAGESALREYAKKPTEYAANHIPMTCVVDIQRRPSALTVYRIDPIDDTGRYQLEPPASGVVTVAVAGTAITVALDDLLVLRQRNRC